MVPAFRSARTLHSPSRPCVPGRTYREDAIIAAPQQHPLQKPPTLVVEKVLIPFIFHKLRNHHDDGAAGIRFRQIQNELNGRNDDEAIWRRQHMKTRRLPACIAEWPRSEEHTAELQSLRHLVC